MTKEEVIATLNGIRQVNDLYAKGETQDEYAERMQRANYAVELAATMLQAATIWTRCTERMPTVEDGGIYGRVNVMYDDGSIDDSRVDEINPNVITHWSRITPIERAEG